jgi:hypothetical protein
MGPVADGNSIEINCFTPMTQICHSVFQTAGHSTQSTVVVCADGCAPEGRDACVIRHKTVKLAS